jgi:hypothetical protein
MLTSDWRRTRCPVGLARWPPTRTHTHHRHHQVAAEQLIAGTGADPSLIPLAASYMRIRALAQPAVLVTMACQGGLLAQQVRPTTRAAAHVVPAPCASHTTLHARTRPCMRAQRAAHGHAAERATPGFMWPRHTSPLQDSRTPALAVAIGVLVNIVSNLVAVAHLGLGLRGAAATTVATQAVGAAVLLLVAKHSSSLAPGLCPVDLTALQRFAATMGPVRVLLRVVCCAVVHAAAGAHTRWLAAPTFCFFCKAPRLTHQARCCCCCCCCCCHCCCCGCDDCSDLTPTRS